MGEREMQSANDEAAVCHVCAARFETQLLLADHLRREHPDDVLDDPAGE
jgi:hypothetical protein